MAGKLKTGVVGAGVFGAFHAGKHATSERVRLYGVCDVDAARAEAVADRFGARAFTDIDAMIEGIDAIVIASPAPEHFDQARRALQHGCHVYVEKPLALSMRDADVLISLAEKNSLVLQVGHQERFVLAGLGVPDGADAPRRLEFARCGPPTGRGEEVSVVFDLMIHDLDIARLFGFEKPIAVFAAGDRDETAATLHFDSGRQCSFIASRRSNARRRLMIAAYQEKMLEIDFVNRTVDGRNIALAAGAVDPFADPLGASIDAFFASILDGRKTIVDGAAGRRALEWALMIEEARDRAAGAAVEKVLRIA